MREISWCRPFPPRRPPRTRLPSCFTRLVVALSLGAARVLVSAAPAMAGALAPAMHTDESTLGSEWPFETDFNDHFETPKRAFRDVRPALRAIAKGRDVEPAALRIYDPYYCRGEACFSGECGMRCTRRREARNARPSVTVQLTLVRWPWHVLCRQYGGTHELAGFRDCDQCQARLLR